MIIVNDLKFLIPEIFLIISILFLLLFGVFFTNKSYYKYINLTKPIIILVIISLILYCYLVLNSICFTNIIANFLFINDNFISFLKVFFSLLLIIILISLYNLNSIFIREFEFFIFIMLIFLGIILVIMSYDFISLFISIELQTLCFYIIIATSKLNKTLEASIKYYILGSFSTALLLLGISLIYFATGLTNFKDLADFLSITDNYNMMSFVNCGFILICLSFFFKLSLAPFHFWLVDIFDGTIRVVLLIFANLSKLAMMLIFYKIYIILFIKVTFNFYNFLIIILLLSWIFGTFGGLSAKKINKLLAYSSINHMAFFLFAIILNNFYGLFIYFIFYSFNLVFIFIFLISIIQANNTKELLNINQLRFFRKINNIGSISLTLCFLSLAGIPPLSGFFAKYFVLIWSMNFGYILVTFFILIIGIISSFFYLRVTKILNFDNNKKWLFIKSIPTFNCFIIIFGIFFNIFFILCIPDLALLAEFFFYTCFF